MRTTRPARRRADAGFVDEHLKCADLARRLNVCTMTIRRAVALGEKTHGAEGIYPVRRTGRVILIPATSANGWLNRLPTYARGTG